MYDLPLIVVPGISYECFWKIIERKYMNRDRNAIQLNLIGNKLIFFLLQYFCFFPFQSICTYGYWSDTEIDHFSDEIYKIFFLVNI